MINRSNIKKYIFCFLAIFLFFISFTFVQASEAGDEEKESSAEVIHPNNTKFIPSNNFKDFSCQADGVLKAVTLKKQSTNTGYTVTFDKFPNEDGVDRIICTYKGKIAVGKTDKKVTEIHEYKYSKVTEYEVTVLINGSLDKIDAGVDVIPKLRDFVELLNVEVTEGKEFINFKRCDEKADNKTCIIQPTTDSVSISINTTEAKIKYKTTDGQEIVARVTILTSINGGPRAYPGNFGTCGFDDLKQWQFAERGGYKFWEANVTRDLPFPTCGSENSKFPVEFKGWIESDFQYTSPFDAQQTDVCSTRYKLIPGGSTIQAQNGKNYIACYEFVSGITLVLGRDMTLDDIPEVCKEISDNTYYCESPDNIVLPGASFDGEFNKDKTLRGWKRESDDHILPVGTSVPTDGDTYSALVDHSFVQDNEYKSIYVNETEALVLSNMKTCSVVSGQEYLSAEMKDSECWVKGKNPTPEDIYADVVIELLDDSTRPFKFTVEDSAGMTEAGNNGFIIDVDERVIFGENDDYVNSYNFFNKVCSTYKIKHDSETQIGPSLYASNYKVNDGCGGAIAMCLDPGRLGPGSSNKIGGDVVNYDKTADINLSSDYGKLIGYISYFMNKNKASFYNNNKFKVAAFVAIRAIAIMDGYTGGIAYSDPLLEGNYEKYEKLANKLSDYYDKYGNNLNGAESSLTKYLTSTFGIYGEYVSPLIDILSHYKEFKVVENQTFERTITSTDLEYINDGKGYQITYRGLITFPSNAELDESLPKEKRVVGFNKSGVRGIVNKFELNEEYEDKELKRKVYEYEFIIIVDDASAFAEPPDTQSEQLDYSFTINYTGGVSTNNIAIANPSGSSILQRMLVFQQSSKEVHTFFDVTPRSENACKTLPALDHTSCTSESECNPNFNRNLFVSSGCCKYVLNEVKYGYIIQNVCNGSCTVSTMQTACSVKPACTQEQIDKNECDDTELYTIKEGAYYESGGYVNNIGTCLVNVSREFSRGAANTKIKNNGFKAYDENGNSLMVSSYEKGQTTEGKGNRYCRVSCGEEWQISAEGFGSFVGANAVTAGSFFSIDKPLFISGKRTCYTTYIDYEKFREEMVSLGNKTATAYNNYSNMSHVYSDIMDKNIDYTQALGETELGKYCVKEKEVSNESCPPGVDSGGEGCTTSTTYECDIYSEDSYSNYSLGLSYLFEDPEAGTGVYNEYTGSGSLQSTGPYGPDTTVKTSCSFEDVPGTHLEQKLSSEECKKYTSGKEGDGGKAAWEKLRQELLAQLADVDAMQTEYSTMSTAMAMMKQYAADMFDCQHFVVYNSSNDGKKNNNIPTAMLEKIAKSYIRIDTAFEPEVSYAYDESAYMTILQRDNILEEYTELNDKYFELYKPKDKNDVVMDKFAKATNVEVNASLKWYDPDDVDISNLGSKTVKLSRNKIDNYYYDVWTEKSKNLWAPNSKEAKNYHDENHYSATPDNTSVVVAWCTIVGKATGTSDGSYVKEGVSTGGGTTYSRDDFWRGGRCVGKGFNYIRANYIKSSLTNSSFYKNKGQWYIKANDIKEHGSTLIEAWENARNRPNHPNYSNEKEALWSKFGSTSNTFPISITTPRNLYQYTYTFGKMGIFDTGRLGRIMGDKNLQVVGSNNRTCFYEVVESVCKCCGDPIVPYTIDDVPSPSEYLESHRDNLAYELSDDDEIGINSNGTLGFTNTTISLNDLDAVGKAGGRTLSTNWGSNAVYRYANSRFHTAKGNLALQAIESIGEKVYEKTPEYSYELTPQTLASIRDYNDIYGYEVNYNNLKIYGRYSISPLKACTDINNCQWEAGGSYSQEKFNNDTVTFRHYGSTFLEEFMEDYTSTTALSRLTGNDNVCVITENATYNELLTLSNSGNCRWIDYIDSENDGTKHYYRLAFK